ncbi:hypothetical protein D7030_09720 [Flavobacteriaceae bacterium AU392]|nr:hypothetical protein D1817_07090 [Flavobacteriaceae bacterium]RKM83565.1 hypothetical protein D7030_09720 [Flavobacteriaceae bacterium AU392]
MKKVFFFICTYCFCWISKGQSDLNSSFSSNPDEVLFYTEDITRFWNVFDETSPKFKSKVWEQDYLEKGSIGLKNFIKNRITSGKYLSKVIKKNLSYYNSIRETSLNINHNTEEFYTIFRKLKAIYPQAVFPDIYFVIGAKNTGGTIFNEGLIIGIERFGKQTESFTPDIPIDELDDTIAHELIHFQQRYSRSNTLLAQCIREGAGDFLGEMLTGHHVGSDMYAYGDAHITELKTEFISRKDGNDWYNWLYYSRDKTRPRNLGYWIGYKICKAYYEKAKDKKQAIVDILNIQDFDLFLRQSEYLKN